MKTQYNFFVTRVEQMGAVVHASDYHEAHELAAKLPAECYVSIGCTPYFSVEDIIVEGSAVSNYGDGHVYTAAEIEGGICSRNRILSEKQKADALRCLIDNGIAEDKSETVLQALCCILLDAKIDK